MLFESIKSGIDLSALPKHPGVYQFQDKSGAVLYVGKAKQLQNRVRSYFRERARPIKTNAMMQHAERLVITLTADDVEALILENNLIKQHRPKYNILFRDDKSYPYLFISDDPFPRLAFHRGAQKEKGTYFGPFPNAGSVHQSLKLIQKIFPVRQCENNTFRNRTRPCLQYQIKRCGAPCVGLIDAKAYGLEVQRTKDFFHGREMELLASLHESMESASQSLDFEKAAMIRDQIKALQSLRSGQSIESANQQSINLDVVVVVEQNEQYLIYVAFVRNGKYLGGKHYLSQQGEVKSKHSMLKRFLQQHYFSTQPPKEIIISEPIKHIEALQGALQQIWHHKTIIKDKVRQDRRLWLALSQKNAESALSNHQQAKQVGIHRLEQLQTALGTSELPTRMECFDISHMQGEYTLASCVVFEQGQPFKQDYRRFKIEGITKGDDYAAMRQALERRYSRLLKEEAKLPDLIIVDGGKGQASSAVTVLTELGLQDIALLSIAKGAARKSGEETFELAFEKKIIDINPTKPAFHVLQHIRDEAHRFAISGHRQGKRKALTRSRLDEIAGVGAKTRQKLMMHFGTVKAIEQSTLEALSRVEGISPRLAQKIYDAFHE